MRIHELKKPEGSTKAPKRIGRGQGTGQGTTAGRGMNGQNSRSGGGVRLGFEGGQMPLYRRLPKRGFNNKWAKEYASSATASSAKSSLSRLRSSARALSKKSKRQAERQRSSNGICEDIL